MHGFFIVLHFVVLAAHKKSVACHEYHVVIGQYAFDIVGDIR